MNIKCYNQVIFVPKTLIFFGSETSDSLQKSSLHLKSVENLELLKKCLGFEIEKSIPTKLVAKKTTSEKFKQPSKTLMKNPSIHIGFNVFS